MQSKLDTRTVRRAIDKIIARAALPSDATSASVVRCMPLDSDAVILPGDTRTSTCYHTESSRCQQLTYILWEGIGEMSASVFVPGLEANH